MTLDFSAERYSDAWVMAHRCQDCRIYLDGVEVKDVWFADTDAGVVRVYERNVEGKVFVRRPGEAGETRDDGLAVLTRYGRVEVVARDGRLVAATPPALQAPAPRAYREL